MRLDKNHKPVFNYSDILNAVYSGKDISNIKFVAERDSDEFKMYNEYCEEFSLPPLRIDDGENSSEIEWFMPPEYQTLDIYEWLLENCKDDPIYRRRLHDECVYFMEHKWDMILRWLKYFFDMCKEEGLITGVGRGSSVSSYALFLIGVHRVDPVFYDIDYRDFLR